MTATLVMVAVAISAVGDLREHPGGQERPQEKYIRVVSEVDSPTRTPADPPKTFSLPAIDAYVKAQVRDHRYPGLSLAIVREGKIVLAKGYGKRSIEDEAPVEPDTMFAVGSVTKQFVCVCILLLAEDGKLSVDDKVAKYYPALSSADQITLYDLMTHTSGYADYYPLDFVDRRLARPIDEDALLAKYAGTKLDFEPGARWSYSNTGYVLLGRVVEKVSGKPLGQFLNERVLDPLRMTHSAVQPRSDIGSRARGYTAFALGPLEPAIPEADGWLQRSGQPVGVRTRPGPMGPRLDGGPAAQARVVPLDDVATGVEELPAHGLRLRSVAALCRR